jgi:MFS family permease
MSWALGSGTILQGMNSSIIAVALVSIAAHFGDSASIPWLVSGLYIASAVASPTAGRLADLFGPRRMYLAGLAIVGASAVAGPFMPSVGWLIADRILIGLGASMHFPAAMAIIRQQAQQRQAGSKDALGIIALCGQTMAAIGPTIGGAIVFFWGWQGIFWVNVPMVINSAVWVLLTVPRDKLPSQRRSFRDVITLLDPPGLMLFVASLVVTMMGLLALDKLQHGDLQALFLVTAALPLWALFIARELRTAKPFVDLRLLAGHRQLLMTCLRAIVMFVAFYCVFYGLPQWYESARGLTPAESGMLMFPVFGVGVLSTTLATMAGRTMLPRVMLMIGASAFLLAGGAMVLFLTTESPYWLMILIGALLGIPNGFNNLGNQFILHHSAPAESAGVASGLYRTSQYIGAALSAVVLTFVLSPELNDGGIHLLGLTIGGIGLALLAFNSIGMFRERHTPIKAA